LARKIRRVVTGVDADGKSVVVSDGEPPISFTLDEYGGTGCTDIWHSARPPKSVEDGGDLDHYSNVAPPPGGIQCRFTEWAPLSAIPSSPDPAKVLAEIKEKMPDFLDHSDLSRLGMHATPTIDMAFVIDGEIWLELDKETVHLKAGDCVVQRGTMHAWRNHGDKPCLMAFVLIEASGKGAE
jgi:mannose-6-phosphate isomerase-like protein (cupin superfamily)